MDVALIVSILLFAMAPADAFSCIVTHVHDGDGPIWCANGVKVRVAGVQAPDFEKSEPCREHRPSYVCDDAAARRSQRIVEQMTLRLTLACRPVDRNYRRVVARCTLPDGRSLSCAILAAGAATRWDRYWRHYRMGDCR